MPTCFIISPIGESGSEIRRNADDLRDLLIKPVLEPMGFNVVRGDHRSEAGQIDIDVIRAVQDSDLCIVDVSLPNPNVYYEFGRRDETGKPLILLKSKGSEDLPVDVATRRYIEYDLDSRRGIIDAMEQLRAFVGPIVERGFESNGNGSSLSELAEILKRVERKIDRLETAKSSASSALSVGEADDETRSHPVEVFRLAIQQKNIPLAERAMEQLRYRMDELRWLDQVVESVAALGSWKAGDLMIQNAVRFIDSNMEMKDKMDYLGCLVTNLTRTDRELDNLDLVVQICETLTVLSANEEPELRIQPYNQLNRLYYGIYGTTKDKKWLMKSIEALEKALKIDEEESFLHYNISLCLNKIGESDAALQHILRCVALDGDDYDDDHLETLCELLHARQDPRLADSLALLEQVSPVKAKLLRNRFNQ